MLDVPVLIVGGGPVGLTASIYLSELGVPSLLVERHPGTAILPKARALNARTMEMYRQLGIEQDIRAVSMPAKFGGMILWAESLAGAEIKRLQPGRGTPGNLALSPSTNCGCSQDILEPVLRARAESFGTERVRFHTEMTQLDCSALGVQATIQDAQGRSEKVRARYLIAADGTQSRIRNQMGIARQGEVDVYDSINIHFRCDLTPWVAERPAALYLIEQPDLRGTFLTINGSNRWGFLVTSLSLYGYSPEQFTPDFCQNIIRKAVGSQEITIEVLGVSAWKASALVAERFREGPVFLAGDAAHEMPPTGGFGLNTGVQDVQNLAWKLAAVIKGEAGAALLDSYDIERRPICKAITESSLLNALSMGRTERQEKAVLPRKQFLNEIGLVFGARYRSTAVLPDGTAQPVEEQVETYIPTAAPGCRAPHVWLGEDERRLSTLDLFGKQFVLLCGPKAQSWREAASRLKGPKVLGILIGEDQTDAGSNWLKAYELEADGAVLVRPDGHVAWRSRGGHADPLGCLTAAYDALLSRSARAQGASS